jgi:ligand-binding SRPBCC domain-containing protein
MESFVHSSRIDQPLEKVFGWHIREGAFERLKPPWEKFKVIGRSGSIQNNGIVKLRTKIGPISMKWAIKHAEYIPEKQFKDIQIKGVFSSFVHLHLFERFGTSCMLEDRIEYSLPVGRVGRLAAHQFVDRNLRKIFDYRHRTINQDLRTHSFINRSRTSERPLTIAITGSTGFVGSSLMPFLTTGDHKVVPLSRNQHVTSSLRINQGQTRSYYNLVLVLGAARLLLTLIGTVGKAIASTTIIFSIQNPEEISAMMTQASDDIQNELTSQGGQAKESII